MKFRILKNGKEIGRAHYPNHWSEEAVKKDQIDYYGHEQDITAKRANVTRGRFRAGRLMDVAKKILWIISLPVFATLAFFLLLFYFILGRKR